MSGRWLAAMGLVVLLASLAPTPVHGQSEGMQGFTGKGIFLRDRTFDNLTINQGNQVRLENVTVRWTLIVEDSYDVQFSNVTIGRGAFLNRNIWMTADHLRVTGLGSYNESGILSFAQDWHVKVWHSAVHWKTIVADTVDGHMSASSFGGPFCRSNAELELANDTFASKECPEPGFVGPFGEGQDSRLVVRNQVVEHDLRISQQGPVSILNTRISGNLYIAASHDINLENVTVDGGVVLDRTNGLSVYRLQVADRLESHHGVDFNVIYSSVGGALICDACAYGNFGNVAVTGEVHLTNSYHVRGPYNMTDSRPPGGNATNGTHDPPSPNGTAPRPIHEECASYEPCRTSPPQSEPVSSSHGPTPFVLPSLPPLPALPEGAGSGRMNGNATAFSFSQRSSALDGQQVLLDVQSSTGVARLELQGRTGTSLRLDSRFEKLIEFDDRDGNGAFDLGDQVVAEHLVAALPVKALDQVGAGDGHPDWTGRVEYGLPDGGVLDLTFTSRDGDGDRTKVDVGIHAYAYHLPTSLLALQVRLESASSWSIAERAGEARLSFHGREADGYFSWVGTAETDGVATPVTSRVLEEHKTEDGRRDVVLFLAYARADDIVHDPSIGVTGAAGGAAARPGQPFILAAAFVATTALLLALRRVPPRGKA